MQFWGCADLYQQRSRLFSCSEQRRHVLRSTFAPAFVSDMKGQLVLVWEKVWRPASSSPPVRKITASSSNRKKTLLLLSSLAQLKIWISGFFLCFQLERWKAIFPLYLYAGCPTLSWHFPQRQRGSQLCPYIKTCCRKAFLPMQSAQIMFLQPQESAVFLAQQAAIFLAISCQVFQMF